jgi:hypothetical protein
MERLNQITKSLNPLLPPCHPQTLASNVKIGFHILWCLLCIFKTLDSLHLSQKSGHTEGCSVHIELVFFTRFSELLPNDFVVSNLF